jgi:hypothetical protein
VKAQYEMLDSSMSGINIPAGNETADELFGSCEPNAPKIRADFKTAHDEPYGSSATSLPTIVPRFT